MYPRRCMPDEEYRKHIRRIQKLGSSKVAHQETCPCCGRKMVNLYRREDTWKCRLCWEAKEQKED